MWPARKWSKDSWGTTRYDFKNFHYIHEYLDGQLWNYCYLNAGLIINLNGKKYVSKNGALYLLLIITGPFIVSLDGMRDHYCLYAIDTLKAAAVSKREGNETI